MAEPDPLEPDVRRERLARGLARLRNPGLQPVEPPDDPPPSWRLSRWAAAASGAALVAAAVAGWLALGPDRPEPAPPPTTQQPAAAAAASGDFILGGYVRANREIHVGSPVSGVVAAMYVRAGARVAAGEVIAELANETLKAQVAGARAAVAAATARLAELEHGPRPEETRRAEAQVAELEAELARARRQLERQQTLAAEGLIASTDLEQAQQDAEVLEARTEAARQSLELLRQGERPERVSQARAELAQTRAVLELAEAQVDQTVIRSPIDGVVTQQHAEVGELVSAGFGGGAAAALVTIADVDELVVEIDVPHGELPRIRLGQPVQVNLEALAGRRYTGRVSWIGPEANRQKLSVPIEVSITGDIEGMLPGLSAKVTFSREPVAGDRPRAAAAPDPRQPGGGQR